MHGVKFVANELLDVEISHWDFVRRVEAFQFFDEELEGFILLAMKTRYVLALDELLDLLVVCFWLGVTSVWVERWGSCLRLVLWEDGWVEILLLLLIGLFKALLSSEQFLLLLVHLRKLLLERLVLLLDLKEELSHAGQLIDFS